MSDERTARRSAATLIALLGLLALGPLALLTYFSVSLSSEAVRREASERVSVIAAGRADAVATELQGLTELVESYARRRLLAAALSSEGPREAAELRRHLVDLQRSRPGIAIAFLAAPDGRLIEIVPSTPSIVGADFSFRDWYRGVTAAGGSYVSEAYATQARGNQRVVAAATPVRDDGGRTVGILAAGYDLEHVQEFVDRVSASHEIALTVTDQRGVVLAAPDRPAGLTSLQGDPLVEAALRGEAGTMRTRGPDGALLSAYASVPGLGWTVTASIPESVAFAGVERLRATVLSVAGVIALVLLAGLAFLGRTTWQRARAEAERAEALRALEEQHHELEQQASELEAQAVELEAQQGELERALTDLGGQKSRIESLFAFSELIARATGVEELARVALADLAEVAGSEVGALYVVDEQRDNAPCLAATRGLAEDTLPAALRPDEGLPGRAVAERRTVQASYGETGLRVTAFGDDVAVRHEMNLPLVHGDQVLGVASLARVADVPFSAEELELLEHLAAQTAVGLANAVSHRATERLAGINRAVLDATIDGIRLVDLEGRTVLANAAMERLAHGALAPDEGGTIWERTADLAERTADPAAYRASMAEIQGDPEAERVDEYRYADTGRWFQRYTAPVRDADGATIGRIFILRDVTPEREAEQLKSDVMATVSHELRTPLASILGFSELLASRETDSDTRHRYIQTIHGEAQRLTNLINDFLDLQRIESGGMRIDLKSFDLVRLLHEKVEVFSGQSAAHELEVDLSPGAVHVLGDRARLEQVVSNLLSNAIKYSPEGGTVSVALSHRGGAVRVSVRDRGLGIPPSQQHKIFDRFFRVDTSDTRKIGGTGLGLALAREIVEAHGGRIGFETMEGEGSTFWFELPAGAQSNGRKRVLVVSDDREATETLAAWLGEDGYEPVIEVTGAEGLARCERDRPELVCLDVGLGGDPDGWQVLATLKSRPATQAIPVLVCTGQNRRGTAAALGAADVLAKPFSGEQLRAALSGIVPEARGSVLVVDDDAAVRRLVVETLERDGLEVREAADGEEALAAVTASAPDAVVLDLVMPKLDGFAVLERLQTDPGTRRIPVVVLTGKQLAAEERSHLTSRAASLLHKNAYSPEELRTLVRNALGNS